MKRSLLLLPLITLAACSPSSGFYQRQQQAIVAMSYTGQLAPYSCGYHALPPESRKGYSKDAGCRHEAKHIPGDQPLPYQQKMPRAVYAPYVVAGEGVPVTPAQSPSNNRQAELESKVASLEKALVSNVGATNQNQQLIVREIASLKAQVEALQGRTSPTMAETRNPTSIHFGND